MNCRTTCSTISGTIRPICSTACGSNVSLNNEEPSIRIWSFSVRYQPTDRPERGLIGAVDTLPSLVLLQLVLQATHGVVSGEPSVLQVDAFGEDLRRTSKRILRAAPSLHLQSRMVRKTRGPWEEFECYSAHETTGH